MDFCIEHGFEFMRSRFGDPIAYCAKCEEKKGSTMTYDKKCYDLAASFLRDKETDSEDEFKSHADALAQMIQEVVEDYMRENYLGEGK